MNSNADSRPGGLSRRRSRVVAVAAAGIALVLLAACSSSKTTGGSTTSGAGAATTSAAPVSAADTAAILKTAFLTDTVEAGKLDPLIVKGLTAAGATYTQDQIDKAYACTQTQECTIGSGKKELGILDGSGADLWRHITRAAITLQATSYPDIGKVIYLQAGGDLQTMNSQLRTLITKGVAGIVTYDDFGAAMTAGFQAATNAGIPVAAFGGTPGSDAVKAVLTQVQSDFCDDGTQMATTTAKMLNNTGSVAFFTGTPGNPQGAGWEKCAEQYFSQNAPGIKVVNKSNTGWSDSGTVSASSALIASGQKVDAILYDYAKETANIVLTYQKAKVQVPNQVTWTSDNSLLKLWEADQGTPKAWKLAYSTSINFEGNIALSAVMAKLAGESVPATLIFPLPFALAQKGDYKADQGASYPGPTLMPTALLTKVLGA
jgi:ABC-type sugar transport system substrate-binding protein